MIRRITVLLTVVALLTASGTALAAVTGSPDFSATLSDDTVVPGEETTLDVVLVNSGDLDTSSSTNPSLNSEVTTARGLTARLGSGDAPISVRTGKKSLGSFPQGASNPLSFEITVDEDAEPGSYEVPVIISYEHYSYISETEGVRDEESERDRLRVSIEVSDQATFDVTDVSSATRVDSTGTVAVTVENTGEEAATDAAVALETQNPDLTFGGASSSSRYVENWSAGDSRTFRYRVTATDNAEPEPYEFGLSVSFQDTDGTGQQSTTTSVGVAPDPEQTFSVVGTESDVPVDNTGEYTVELRNDGPVTVTDATVSISSQTGDITFGGSGSTTRFVGEWSPGETRTITVDATAGAGAETRSYALSTQVSYEDPEGDDGQSEGLSVGLTPEPEQSFDLGAVDTTLRAGDDGRLNATLTNTGERAVENLVLNWQSDHTNISPQETQYAVGDLDPGQSATVSFGVDVSDSADAGPRQFDFAASYRDDDGDRRQSDTLEIRADVAGQSDEFAVRTENATVRAGGSATLTLTVTNTAGEPLSDISAKLFADSPISVNDDEAYVQSLGPGESTTLTFSISAGGGALEKAYPVSLDFQYEEPDGDTPVSDTYRVPVEVTTSDGGGGFPLLAVGGLALVSVLAIGGYFRFR